MLHFRDHNADIVILWDNIALINVMISRALARAGGKVPGDLVSYRAQLADRSAKRLCVMPGGRGSVRARFRHGSPGGSPSQDGARAFRAGM